MKDITITIVDEVHAFVHGLEPCDLQVIYEQYAVYANNYFFHPKFQLGVWDGRIPFFKQDGYTYVRLLPDIIKKISSFKKYKMNLKDNRVASEYQPKLIDKNIFNHFITEEGLPLVLYEHQVDVVNALLEEGSGIALAATGAGKSYICSAVALRYNEENARVLVVVPSQDLVFQTRKDFLDMNVDCGEYSGDVKDYKTHNTVMSTWQALQHNPEIIKGFNVIIVDECHGAKGQVLQDLLNNYGKHIIHRFGVTGTLPKAAIDLMAVRITIGSVLIEVPAKLLMDLGVLSKLNIHIEQTDEDLTTQYEAFLKTVNGKKPTYNNFKEHYFSDYPAEKSYIQRHTIRQQYIIDKFERCKQSGNTLVLVDGVSLGKRLAKLIPGAVFIHGNDKKKARKQIYDLFATVDNLLVIATVNIASTGLNIKRIYNLILLDIGKSFIRVIQSIGRGLRKAKDKDFVDVYDICCDFKYGKKHLTERLKYYNEAQYPYQKKKIELSKFLVDF